MIVTSGHNVQQSVQCCCIGTVQLDWRIVDIIWYSEDRTGANILFTYESRLHLDSSDGRSRVYRRVGARYVDACVVRSFGGCSVMVWGGITERSRTALVVVAGNLTGMRYRDAMLFLPSKLRLATSYYSRTTIYYMLRVLYVTTWHSIMLMCYRDQRFHLILHALSTSGWNGTTVMSSAKSASHVSGNESGIDPYIEQYPTNIFFITHWLDQCVAVAKPASMQMVNTHTTDFVQ